MKAALLVAALAGLGTAQAQSLDNAEDAGLPEGSVPVASPNRISSSQLVQRRPVNVLPPGQSKQQVVLIDAAGRTLGRSFAGDLFGNLGIATIINGLNTLLVGLAPPSACDSNGQNCVYAQGFEWSTDNGALYYSSEDCSGSPSTYFSAPSLGFDRVGVAVRDADGSTYMYLADATPRLMTVRSLRFGYSSSTTCYGNFSFTNSVLPLVEVHPISMFGKPPFKWK